MSGTTADCAENQTHHLWIGKALNAPPIPERRILSMVGLPSDGPPVVAAAPARAALLISCSLGSLLTTEILNGALLVACLLWEGRNTKERTMRLPKAMGLRFTRACGVGVNPVSFVCNAWGCKLLFKGKNLQGNQTNVWSYPDWADGRTVKLPVALTPYQRERWRNRNSILIGCSNKANPAAALVRETLALTTEGCEFANAALELTKKGEVTSVRCFRATPTKVNVTRDGDIQSVVSRLPERLRSKLQIAGQGVAEFDIKSAHAVLMGMLYDGEAGSEWAAERSRFLAEAKLGFVTIYGDHRQHKKAFLSALNQSPTKGRHASSGYREFERLFPLLAEKSARVRWKNTEALGSLLRSKLAVILRDLVKANHADGIRCLPVVDSAVVAMPGDLWKQHQAEFRTAWRLGVPIKAATGASALIEGSNGKSYRFF